jgi:hypothetical protein
MKDTSIKQLSYKVISKSHFIAGKTIKGINKNKNNNKNKIF